PDTLSGIGSRSPPGALVLSAEGLTVTGQVTVTDRAGNTTAATSPGFNIDKTPPTVSISSPVDGSSVNTANLPVSGNASDGLSGVAAVICNGASGSAGASSFNCTVSLTEGANSID